MCVNRRSTREERPRACPVDQVTLGSPAGISPPDPDRGALARPSRAVRPMEDRVRAPPLWSADGTWEYLLQQIQAAADADRRRRARPLTRRARRPASSLQARRSQQPQTRSSTEHSGALPLHGLRAAILFHPRNACLYRRATISSSIRAVIEVRWEPPPSTWAVTVTTASLSGEIMQSWP
jgi:hypothetical protein